MNKQRILRLLREDQLLVQPNMWLKARRTSAERTPRPTKPNDWWGNDTTKVLVEDSG